MATANRRTGPSDAQIIAKLRRKPKTRAALGVSAPIMARLERQGIVVRVGVEEPSGKRGRPGVLYGLAEDV